MPSITYCRLSDLIQLSSLPTQFSLISGTFANALEKIYYKNLNIQHNSADFIFSANLEIIAPRQLKLSIPIASGSDFALVLNPEEHALSGLTTFPISFTSALGIRKYYPLGYDFNFPVLPSEIYEILLKITGRQDNEVVSDFANAFIENSASNVATSQLDILATNLNSHFGQSNGLAIPILDPNYITALTQITNAFASTSPAISVNDALYDLYINSSSIADSIENLRKIFVVTIGEDPISLVSQLLVPRITASAHVSAGLQFPRSILAPVKINQDGTYSVDSDINVKATILFAKAELSFSSKAGFGYDTQVSVSLPATHPRLQIGNTGIQISFTTAKLDLSSEANIPEAVLDGRSKDFKGIYVEQASVFLPEGWTIQQGASAPTITINKLLVGTGGLSGSISAINTQPGYLISAKIHDDLSINFTSFSVEFIQNKPINSAISGIFLLNNFHRQGTTTPAEFAFSLSFSANGYLIAFTDTVNPVSVELGSLGIISFTRLAIGYEEGNWYLEANAIANLNNSLPIIGKVLPKQINIRRLLLSTDSNKTALDVQPVWADGTTVSGNLTSGLSISQTLNKVIGDALRVEAMRLALVRDTVNNRVKALTTFDASLKLGVGSSFGNPAKPTEIPNGFLLRVKNVGFYTEAEFRPTGGDVGPAELTTDFKLPDGVAVSINAGGVKGSGSLAVLENGNRYEASITLGFYDIKAAAYAILLKNLPSGEAGPSLLALISADFRTSPLKLGLGFQLEAVGGLVGLHRTVSISVLRAGLSTGALSNLLFPEDPAQNAATILRSIDQAFPPAAGRHTFGLMARLTWGASSLSALEAGLIIELPSYRIVLIGILTINLPDKSGSLIKLRADFLGEIDFGAKKVSFDAILVKSSVRDLPLNGSFAFRLYQGDNPVFIMAAGGFHPAFHPPANANLPTLPRLSIALAQRDDFRLILRGYIAVTSNTAQFGSSLELYAKVLEFFNVSGFLSFDALFQFNPFWLSVQFEARVAIKKGNTSIVSISLRLALTGPAPWHVSGEASFRCIWSYSFKIDRTFGGSVAQPALPSVNVRQLLLAALSDKVNWEIQQPPLKPGNTVVLRVEDQPSELVVDPGGALVVRQKVAPLDYLIQLFNNALPVNGDQFRVSSVEVGENTNLLSLQSTMLGDVRDAFAPGQFRRMSNAEKLSAPSFQFMRSGLRLNTIDGLTGIGGPTRTLAFEQRIFTASTGGTTGNRAAADSTDGTTAQNPEVQSSTTTQTTTTTPDPVLTGEPAFTGWTSDPITQAIALPADKIAQLSRTGAVGRSSRSYEQKRPSRLAPDRVSWSSDSYAIVSTRDLQLDELAQIPFPTEAEATAFLVQRLADDPELVGELQVLPVYQLDVSTPSTSANLVTA